MQAAVFLRRVEVYITGSIGSHMDSFKLILVLGSGGGSLGRAVTSKTRDPRFKSQHHQNFNRNRKDQNKEKEAGMAHLEKPLILVVVERAFVKFDSNFRCLFFTSKQDSSDLVLSLNEISWVINIFHGEIFICYKLGP